MKINKLSIAMLGLAATIATACDSTDDSSYEMTLQRNLLVASVGSESTAVRTTLTGMTVGMDMYNNTTASIAINNVVMPNGSLAVVKADPLRYSITSNQLGYLFQPQASTLYTGLSSPTTLTFYMGGISQVNSRLEIVDGSTKIVGYGNMLYLFTTSTIIGGESPVNSTESTKNVIQVLLQNGSVDGQYKANIYWAAPYFDSAVSESEILGFGDLTASIDPTAGTLTIASGDTPIVPRSVENGSTSLGQERTDYAVSNIAMVVGDLVNNVGRLTFDFEYTPVGATAPTTYHFNATLRESPELL